MTHHTITYDPEVFDTTETKAWNEHLITVEPDDRTQAVEDAFHAGWDAHDDRIAAAYHLGRGKGYDAGQRDLYETAANTVEEWRDLKIIDDHQALMLNELLHHLDTIANYVPKREAEQR